MGCQYKIANKIVSKEGEYIFSLKGNQGLLLEDVKLFLISGAKTKTATDYDKGHGRLETRTCYSEKRSFGVAQIDNLHKLQI